MKTIAVKSPALCSGLLMTIVSLGVKCSAQSQGQELQPMGATLSSPGEPGSEAVHSEESTPALSAWKSQKKADEFTESRLGLSLLRNITLDQKAIWTSPAHLRLDDANWILPFAGIAAASLASDTHISKALTHSTTLVSRSTTFSNYGIAAFAVVPGGLYLLGKMTDDDHKRETGVLSGEAALDAVGASTVLQYAIGRQRPMDGKGGGGFWRRGTSFPSDHATAAWAVASVIAHEYPGPLTKLFVYGLASAVSVSRATGKEHFPTDVIAGAAIGWFVGQHVYRAHHDPELGGSDWGTSAEVRDSSSTGNSRHSGSPYVPLDSWIYPAIDRLAALDYIHSAFQDMRPWSRIECATLVQEAGDEIAARESTSAEADRLYAALQKEFQSEFAVLDGAGAERSIQLESLYANATQISGQPLNDSYHFGQTIIDNSGRPYQEGFNTYAGFSGYGTTGRYAIYVRGEFQHAPSAPAFPLAARETISAVDYNPVQPATPVSVVNQFTLLDAYAAVNLGGWELSFGKQSLWWGRGEGGALLFSDNAEPIYMFRARPIESFELPSVFRWLGPMKTDFFFGELSGLDFPPRPLIHGVKISFKRTQNLEMSFVFTSELGGVGRPLTPAAIFNSFFSIRSSVLYSPTDNPGKRTLGYDFAYKFPHLRNRLAFYANGLLPEDNPTNLDMSQSPLYIPRRAAIRTGIYLPQIPGVPKLDFRVEAAYTDPPTPRSVRGLYIYWNDFYHDLYMNKNNLIGDWVGREGMGFQGWSTYWFSPRKSLQFGYRHAKVAGDFIPGGETLNDASAKVSWQLRDDWSVSAGLQYEKWLVPILTPAAQTNWTSSINITFWPQSWNK